MPLRRVIRNFHQDCSGLFLRHVAFRQLDKVSSLMISRSALNTHRVWKRVGPTIISLSRCVLARSGDGRRCCTRGVQHDLPRAADRPAAKRRRHCESGGSAAAIPTTGGDGRHGRRKLAQTFLILRLFGARAGTQRARRRLQGS